MENTAQSHFARVRGIHTFVIRAGRMTAAQKRDYTIHSARWCLPYHEKKLDFPEIYKNSSPVTVEIGFGMGKATAIIASENPDINYLGLEVHRAGVGRLLGEIETRGLSNIRIIEYDAIEVLLNMIADNSVAAFHIFFPDPWPKKKHHKRRLLQRPRTDLLVDKLISGGYIYMATDWQPYGEDAYAELSATPGIKSMYDGFAPRQSWRPETRFEKKGLEAQHEIFELMFRKVQPEE